MMSIMCPDPRGNVIEIGIKAENSLNKMFVDKDLFIIP